MWYDLIKPARIAPAVALAAALCFVSTAHASASEQKGHDNGRSGITAKKQLKLTDISAAEETFYRGSFAAISAHKGLKHNDFTIPTESFGYALAESKWAAHDFGRQGIAGIGAINQQQEFSSSPSLVPEPGVYAMLMAGLGLMGVVVRRRRSSREK